MLPYASENWPTGSALDRFPRQAKETDSQSEVPLSEHPYVNQHHWYAFGKVIVDR